MRGVAMLPEKDALPGAERQPTVADRDRQADGKMRRLDMGGHVVRAFGAVAQIGHVGRIGAGDQPVDPRQQIPAHVRIGVFLNDQRTGGVAHEQRRHAAGIGQPARHAVGDVCQAGTVGADLELRPRHRDLSQKRRA